MVVSCLLVSFRSFLSIGSHFSPSSTRAHLHVLQFHQWTCISRFRTPHTIIWLQKVFSFSIFFEIWWLLYAIFGTTLGHCPKFYYIRLTISGASSSSCANNKMVLLLHTYTILRALAIIYDFQTVHFFSTNFKSILENSFRYNVYVQSISCNNTIVKQRQNMKYKWIFLAVCVPFVSLFQPKINHFI